MFSLVQGKSRRKKEEVQDRIARAQRAILNPSTDPQRFLDEEDPDLSIRRELTFSTNCVSLQISGDDVEDLSFVDLPGQLLLLLITHLLIQSYDY